MRKRRQEAKSHVVKEGGLYFEGLRDCGMALSHNGRKRELRKKALINRS